MYCNQCASYSCIHLLQGLGGMAEAQQQQGSIMSELMMQHYRGHLPIGLSSSDQKPKTNKKLLLLRK